MKPREVCSWQKAQLVQRPGDTEPSAREASSGGMQPEWRVGAAGGGGLRGGEGGSNPSETLAVMAQAL